MGHVSSLVVTVVFDFFIARLSAGKLSSKHLCNFFVVLSTGLVWESQFGMYLRECPEHLGVPEKLVILVSMSA